MTALLPPQTVIVFLCHNLISNCVEYEALFDNVNILQKHREKRYGQKSVMHGITV